MAKAALVSKKWTTPKKKAVEDAARTKPKMNEKGEIVSWSAQSDDRDFASFSLNLNLPKGKFIKS